ncbi:hypothetical protein LCGC14_0883750 [marine sediment metagenome]|uniref:Uncharacterized protein n=1 Tax=marine sediment metagenome TaxID=412755 RepID=A0A0F9PLS4_9ZZZZ
MKADAGIYFGKLKEVEVGATGKNKTPRLRLTFAVTDKANQDNDWEALDGQLERSVDLYLTDKALQWTEDKLAVLGFDGNYVSPSVQSFSPELSADGCQMECTIKTKQDGKGTFEEWTLVMLRDVGTTGLDPLQGNELDRLSARFKQSQANTRKPESAPGAPVASNATLNQGQTSSAPPRREPEDDAPVPEDDTPF